MESWREIRTKGIQLEVISRSWIHRGTWALCTERDLTNVGKTPWCQILTLGPWLTLLLTPVECFSSWKHLFCLPWPQSPAFQDTLFSGFSSPSLVSFASSSLFARTQNGGVPRSGPASSLRALPGPCLSKLAHLVQWLQIPSIRWWPLNA